MPAKADVDAVDVETDDGGAFAPAQVLVPIPLTKCVIVRQVRPTTFVATNEYTLESFRADDVLAMEIVDVGTSGAFAMAGVDEEPKFVLAGSVWTKTALRGEDDDCV